MYGIEILTLFFGALVFACSPSFQWLLVARVIMGFGIGGDYPTSAVVATEYANRKNRGFIVLMVFAMQTLGLIIGPLLASSLMAVSLPYNIIWRLLLGFGAIPAGAVYLLRRRIAETPHFLLSQKPSIEVSRAISTLINYQEPSSVLKPQIIIKKLRLLSMPWIQYLISTASTWFLLDIAFYGNGISSAIILKNVNPSGSLLKNTLISMLFFICCAVPGYYCAAKYVDKIGRKSLQIQGFLMMVICYLAIASFKQPSQELGLFCILFGLSFFFVNFGPNATTFLIPSEIFPTQIRATAHGISAALGKISAFIGAFFYHRFYIIGLAATMVLLSLVSGVGAFMSQYVPDMSKRSLKTIETLLATEASIN